MDAKSGRFSRRGVLFGAAGGLASISFPAFAQQKVTLKLGHQYPIDHPISLGVEKARELVAERTDGRVQLTVYPAGQLGTGKEIDQQVSDGSIDFCVDGPGIIGNWHRPLSIYEAPFVARDWPHLVKMLDCPWGREQFAILSEKQNLHRIGSPWYYGARHFTTRDRAMKTAADAKGLKLRVPEVPVYLDMIRAIGAAPTPMALSEVYLSLQTGVVDGQENPLPTIGSQKFFEVQKFLNLTAHIVTPQIILASTQKWKTIAEPDQRLLTECFDAGGDVSDVALNGLEKSLIETFKGKGMTVVESDRDSFRVAMKSVYEKNEASWGKGVLEELQKIA